MTIRVLLTGPARQWEALCIAIAAADDFEAVGTAETPIDALVVAGQTQADVVAVLAGSGGEPPGIVSHLLTEYPNIKILSVAGGNRATLFLLQPQEVPIADGSPAELLNAIRTFMHE